MNLPNEPRLSKLHFILIDAVFLAVGAHIGKRAMFPSGDAAKIVDTLDRYFASPGHPLDQLCIELTETTAVAHLGRTREFIGEEVSFVWSKGRAAKEA